MGVIFLVEVWCMQNNNELNTFTVGDLKAHLSGLDDDCIINFSTISGISPEFYRIKSLAYDSNDNVTEILFEFGNPG